MDQRVTSLTQRDISACAEPTTRSYLQDSGERLFYLGEPFGTAAVEQQLIDKADETYEAWAFFWPAPVSVGIHVDHVKQKLPTCSQKI